MADVLVKEAKITAQGQITIPAPIRENLGVSTGDTISFAVDTEGSVMVRRSDDPDPALASFLEFLANDIQRHPERVRPVTDGLEKRLRVITRATIIDKENDHITGDVGL